MKVRMASEKDIERIHELLSQVALVHQICSNTVRESIRTNSCGRS